MTRNTRGLIEPKADISPKFTINNFDDAQINPIRNKTSEPLIKTKNNSIARTGLISGIVGLASAFSFQYWVATIAYPLRLGGKPFFAFPSFIWVSLECAILFAGIGMFSAFLKELKKPDVPVNLKNQNKVAKLSLRPKMRTYKRQFLAQKHG